MIGTTTYHTAGTFKFSENLNEFHIKSALHNKYWGTAITKEDKRNVGNIQLNSLKKRNDRKEQKENEKIKFKKNW